MFFSRKPELGTGSSTRPEVCLRHPIDQNDNNESLVATQPGDSKIDLQCIIEEKRKMRNEKRRYDTKRKIRFMEIKAFTRPHPFPPTSQKKKKKKEDHDGPISLT